MKKEIERQQVLLNNPSRRRGSRKQQGNDDKNDAELLRHYSGGVCFEDQGKTESPEK